MKTVIRTQSNVRKIVTLFVIFPGRGYRFIHCF